MPPMSRSGMNKLTKAELLEVVGGYEDTVNFLQESMVELQLALDDDGWRRLSFGTREHLVTASGIRKSIDIAEASYLTNPLIHHAVDVQANYVFAQGVSVRAKPSEQVNEVLQAFWDDPLNQMELTSAQSMWEKEISLRLQANLFFVFFPNIFTGQTRIRTIPVREILSGGIITNPQDRREPWYYHRVWEEYEFNPRTGDVATTSRKREAYYPDWRYHPVDKPKVINGKPVKWLQPVYHVKVGGLSDMRFGFPEIYSALDWARAVRLDLEDYATLRRALARFAWLMTVKGGKEGVAKGKAKLQTALGVNTFIDTNPAPVAGSTAIMDDSRNLSPIRTAGATPSPEEGRRLWLMVSAGTGIPETILAGNADVGNLATARTLDRPTELQMRNRQTLWSTVLSNIGMFVIANAASAPQGIVIGDVVNGVVELPSKRQNGKLVKQKIEVVTNFPKILEPDTTKNVKAVVDAATLAGKTDTGMFPQEDLLRRLLEALGENDIDGALEIISQERSVNEQKAQNQQQQPPSNGAQPAPPNGTQPAPPAAVPAGGNGRAPATP